jgi:imidazolonepropionase-like amidohydrolase
MSSRSLLVLSILAALAARAEASRQTDGQRAGRGMVAIRAGTIHLVEDGRVLTGGATMLVRGTTLEAIGKDVAVPPDAELVDYGPDAVVIPGLVSAYPPPLGVPSRRTAEPGLAAIDAFDFTTRQTYALSGGVTTLYLSPAENRLIAGQGALVKLAGESDARRLLRVSAALHGAIDGTSRNAPGYWDPPVPATSDVGLGYAVPQLPKTTAGAIVALGELLSAARAGRPDERYGPYAASDLAACLRAELPWRIGAVEVQEIRALLDFATANDLPLVIDRAFGAKPAAAEIAAAGASVIFQLPFQPNSWIFDRGKSPDAQWPEYDTPAALVRAGVRVAISSPTPRDLLFAAAAASKGGLDEQAALRAITLTPAEIFGASERVGSLRPGKDADFVVLNDQPISGRAGVVATWVDGKLVWSPRMGAERSARSNDPELRAAARALGQAVVVHAAELHVGDGTVLRPGELLLEDGKIVDIGETVARPAGAIVVHAPSAMPGMIDAFGHLGLEGAGGSPGLDFRLASIVAPGDRLDRRVAGSGITTVAMAPRGTSPAGVPVLAYKPAASRFDGQVLADPAALRLPWSNRNRLKSGENARELLEKAKQYREKWLEYEEALAKWKPEPTRPEAGPEAKKEGEEKTEGAEGEDGEKKEGAEEASKQGEASSEDKKDEDEAKKKKKKKKEGEEELSPDPITGLWQAEIVRPPRPAPVTLKMRLKLEAGKGSGTVIGSLRCDAVSETLVELRGAWEREAKKLALEGLGRQGWVTVAVEHKEGKLVGKISISGTESDLAAEQKSTEYPIATRSERRAPSPVEEPKGKPKSPKVDDRLEPFRRAMEGRGAILVDVDREDEIRACVDAFAAYGIKPVLFGAPDAHHALDALVGRVAGVLMPNIASTLDQREGVGTQVRNDFELLQSAGIPVAFKSEAEEGAAELPMRAAYAVSQGMSPAGALRALTFDAARMLAIEGRVGRLARGLDADVLLLDGPPLAPGTSVVRVFVNGEEVKP